MRSNPQYVNGRNETGGKYCCSDSVMVAANVAVHAVFGTHPGHVSPGSRASAKHRISSCSHLYLWVTDLIAFPSHWLYLTQPV